MSPFKKSKRVHLKLLSPGNVNNVCRLLSSLSDNTRRYYQTSEEIHNFRSYIKTYFLLLTTTILNKWLYKTFGRYSLRIIALHDHEGVVGLAHLDINSHEAFKSANYGIVVRDDYHGKGVGTTLTSHIIDLAKKFGVHLIWLTVLTDNTKAIKLYKKFGFVIEGHHKRTTVRRGKISDVYYMSLHLS